VILCYKK